MAFLGSLTKESVKGLGPGAFLVSVLPSAVLVLILFALPAASLYPWSPDQRDDQNQPIADGLPAIVESAKDLGVGGTVVLVLGVLLVAVLMRPFQIAAVQILEGYWTSWWWTFPAALAIERHRRRRSLAIWRADSDQHELEMPADHSFVEVARALRQVARSKREKELAEAVLDGYPQHQQYILPTRLGNILRKAETSAGERYGLDTFATYPRLYPHLSTRLDVQMSSQMNILDVSAALALVLTVSSVASVPLLGRPGWDWWRLLPVGFAIGAVVAYAGARHAAGIYSDLLHTTYDLHRFDMLVGLHRAIPGTPDDERQENSQLTMFLTGEEPLPPPRPALIGMYRHPEPPAAIIIQSPTAVTPDDGKATDDGKGDGGKTGDEARSSCEPCDPDGAP